MYVMYVMYVRLHVNFWSSSLELRFNLSIIRREIGQTVEPETLSVAVMPKH